MNIQEIRKQFPQYDDLSDAQLATSLHQKFYSDIPFDDFSKRIGVVSRPPQNIPEGTDISDFNISSLDGPSVAQGNYQPPEQKPAGLKEKLFGTPGSEIMPGAEPIKWAYENPEAVAATAASIMAPEIALPAWAARLGAAGKIAAPAITNAAKIAAAAAGGGIAGGIKEAVRDPSGVSDLVTGGDVRGAPTLGSIASEAGKGALSMGAAELGGAYLSPLIGKLFKPGASSMTPESRQALQLARENNLPISPSSVAPSLPSKLMEGALDRFAPSKLVNDSYRKKAIQTFNRMAVELPEKEGVGSVLGNTEITKQVMGSLDEILGGTGKVKGLQAAAKESREAFLGTIGKDKKIPVSQTLQALKKVKADAVDPKLRDMVITKLQSIGRGNTMTAEGLDTLMSQLGSAKVSVRTDQKFLTAIREAAKEDFKLAGADMGLLDDSAKQFSESFGALKGSSAKQLKAMLAKGEEPTFLTEKLYREESSSLLSSLKSRLPKEVSDSLDAQNLTNMIMNSTKDGPIPGLRILDGNKLEKIVKANQGVLKRNYSASTVEAMNNLIKLSKASASDLSAAGGMTKGEQATQMGALAAWAKFEPVSALMSSSSAAALANSMMRPKGWANRWLTTGVPGAKAASEGLKVGGRLVFEDGE